MSPADDANSGFYGLELTAYPWLRDHFLAKLPRRVHQVAQLPIETGDRVLDVCCGPGFYTQLFAQMVGPTGIVCGIDYDPSLIDIAETQRTHFITQEFVKYFCHDAITSELPGELRNERYDVIVFFNCLSYFSDPTSIVLKYKNLLSDTGKIILKDSDFGHILIHPFDDVLKHRIIELAQRNNSLTFDNFFGRRLPSISRSLPNANFSVEIWSYPMTHPLTPEEKAYAAINLSMLPPKDESSLNQEDLRLWREFFPDDVSTGLVHNPEFFFLMHEVVTINSFRH